MKSLEKSIRHRIRVWLGLSPGLSSVALYIEGTRLRLLMRSTAEECKVGKIRTHLMIKTQEEIRNAEQALKFEEITSQIQHSVGWNHFTKWFLTAPVASNARKAGEMESERISKAVQQAKQGQWTTWEEVVQRSIVK